jgi:hypothetical protein
MSIATLTNTCPSCGAEESLDAVILRMIDDDQVRRLIASVLTTSLPLGGLLVRYLRQAAGRAGARHSAHRY